MQDGNFVIAVADKNDLVYLGGLPAGKLKEAFGVWAEETDSLPEDKPGSAEFNNKTYKTQHICDIIHSSSAEILGTYTSDFYAGLPAVTKNSKIPETDIMIKISRGTQREPFFGLGWFSGVPHR